MPPEITADIIDPIGGPAHSAVSDMPAPDADPPAPTPAPEPTPEPVEPSADPAEPDDGGAPPAEPAAAKPRSGIQQRFSELTAEKKVEQAKREAAEEYAARLERLLADRQREPEPRQPDPVPEPQRAEPRPRRDDFIDPDAYDVALDHWYTAQTERALEVKLAEREQHQRVEHERQQQAERQQAEQQRQHQHVEATYQERATKFAEQHPDYEERVQSDDLKISVIMANAIKTNDDGPAVAYYLAEHPEEAARIASFNVPGLIFPQGHELAGQPVPDIGRQVFEMGKLFASVTSPAVATAPRAVAPTTPPPVTPLRRSSAPAVQRSMQEVGDDPDGMAEYAAQRTPQLQAERRPGYRG